MTDPKKSLSGMSILFAGSGEFGVPSLNRLVERGATIARVFTQPDKPAGRGKHQTPTPIGAFAIEQELDLVRTADINQEDLPYADLMVVIAFGQKLLPHVVDHARLGAVNLHASRLPKYRGAAPINWAVITGDKVSGNSIIRLAQRMDAGQVLAMSSLDVGDTETAGELYDRLSLDGADLVECVAIQLRDQIATPLEQDHSLATRAPKLSREASSIDFNRDATDIANQIRGMHPWPGCRVKLMDGTTELDRFTIVRARPIHAQPITADTNASTKISFTLGMIDEHLHVLAGRGNLKIIELHPDGRRPMTLDAYRNGRPWTAGFQLVSLI